MNPTTAKAVPLPLIREVKLVQNLVPLVKGGCQHMLTGGFNQLTTIH